MKNVFISAEKDTLLLSLLNLKNPNALGSMDPIQEFALKEPHDLPYVSEYMVDFDITVEALRRFIGYNVYKSFLRVDYLVILPDDMTSIETRTMEQIIVNCGAKSCITEFRAFLLSNEPEYLAITASKRAVTVTHVYAESDESEQIFLDIHDADAAHIAEACHMLDEVSELPVYSYGLPPELEVGTVVEIETMIRNFVRLQ